MNQNIRLLFLFFICCIPGGHLMAQTWDWAVQFGDEGNEIISGFETGDSGDYFMAGGFYKHFKRGRRFLCKNI